MINLTINLLNPNLQRRIAEDKGLDTDATEALKILLSKGLNNLQNDLEDWTTEEYEGNNVLFYKGKNYVPANLELQQEF
jgi:hypothetical protein